MATFLISELSDKAVAQSVVSSPCAEIRDAGLARSLACRPSNQEQRFSRDRRNRLERQDSQPNSQNSGLRADALDLPLLWCRLRAGDLSQRSPTGADRRRP